MQLFATVTEFLGLCCSSVLPGGGTNTELALHCLHEVQGDNLVRQMQALDLCYPVTEFKSTSHCLYQAALDLLLVRGDYRTSCHPLSDYHYTGIEVEESVDQFFCRILQYNLLKFHLSSLTPNVKQQGLTTGLLRR